MPLRELWVMHCGARLARCGTPSSASSALGQLCAAGGVVEAVGVTAACWASGYSSVDAAPVDPTPLGAVSTRLPRYRHSSACPAQVCLVPHCFLTALAFAPVCGQCHRGTQQCVHSTARRLCGLECCAPPASPKAPQPSTSRLRALKALDPTNVTPTPIRMPRTGRCNRCCWRLNRCLLNTYFCCCYDGTPPLPLRVCGHLDGALCKPTQRRMFLTKVA